jgi:hypothetical protein
MKNHIKYILASVIPITFSFAVIGQTNVSGGIYANTTWTKVNSPYIVTDTVVVFPGYTLTIQPGVTVKFADSTVLELRQAKLIAKGTRVDSITFTNNSDSLSAGIYTGIYLNGGDLTSTFNYCNVSHAKIGINAAVGDSLIVNNSNFNENLIGLQYAGRPNNEIALIDSSIFRNNTNGGLILSGLAYATTSYCNFTNNGTEGMLLYDDFGVGSTTAYSTTSYCNFSNNGTGLQWDMHYSTMSHCNFFNNGTGLQGGNDQSGMDLYNNITKNCIFEFNQLAINSRHMSMANCMINYNQTGFTSVGNNSFRSCTIDSNTATAFSTWNDSIINCNIKYNGNGIQADSYTYIIGDSIEYNTVANISGGSVTLITGNTIRYSNFGIDVGGSLVITHNIISNNNIGINLSSSSCTLSCNSICSNTTYDFKYLESSNFNASDNYWCTSDSASIQAMIYDGYNNVNYGLVTFMPIDSACSPSIITYIKEIKQEYFILVYPNPATINLTIETPQKAVIEITNIQGQLVKTIKATGNKTNIDVSALPGGVYIVQAKTVNGVSVSKFIKE